MGNKKQAKTPTEATAPTADDPLLTAAEIGRQFRVNRGTALRWIVTGKLPSVKTPSGLRKVRLSEAQKLLGGVANVAKVAPAYIPR